MSPAPAGVIARTPLLTAVATRAFEVIGPHDKTPGYLSEAGIRIDNGVTEAVPLVANDPLKRVRAYWVLHPYGGNPGAERALEDSAQVDLDWGFQLTVAGGFTRDVLAVVARAEAAFHRWRIPIEGGFSGRLRSPDGYDPGPPRVDLDVSPHRFWLPLQYGTTITTT